MGALRRILLTVWGLLLVALASLLIVCMIRVELADYLFAWVQRWFLFGVGLWQTVGIVVILLVVGIFVLICAWYRKPQTQLLAVVTTDGSKVNVGFTALDNIARKAAMSINKVSDVNCRIVEINSSFGVIINLKVPLGTSIPDTAAAVRAEVERLFTDMIGSIPAQINVTVDNVVDQRQGG